MQTPVDVVIATFGGVRAVARIVDRDPAAVSRCRRPKNEGGTGGKVPQSWHETLLAEAKRIGKELSTNDIIFGRGGAARAKRKR